MWITAALLLAGCATAPTPIEKKDIAAPAEEEKAPTIPRLFEERDLLLEGVVLLEPPERSDPVKARSIFISLIQRYPQSRWRPAAEAFIRLIDERNALQEVNRQDRLLIEKTQTEKARALQENDQLKKTVRELTEKLQSETAALTQENEQLKKGPPAAEGPRNRAPEAGADAPLILGISDDPSLFLIQVLTTS